MWKLILPLLFLSLEVRSSEFLPSIFYAPESEQESYCRAEEFQVQKFWRTLFSEKIDAFVKESSDQTRNSYVTLSYLELFKISQNRHAEFMGYVYANASHHLGRLVRYKSWPKEHPLKKADQSLVKGLTLKLVTAGANQELSRRLMHYSVDLYKELSWSLGALALCGREYTLRMTEDPNLRKAIEAFELRTFVKHFVTYEQTYLQKTMYQDLLISSAAKAKVLDEMRFISFNGKEQISFFQWCSTENCGTSSFDLKNRISFDVFSINEELLETGAEKTYLFERLEQASIRETAFFFIQK